MNAMDVREQLFDSALEELDKSIKEHFDGVKAKLYEAVYHAYNKGLMDGKSAHMAAEKSLSIGDEVVYYDKESDTIFPSNRFIVTEMDIEDGGFIGGITENGHTCFHDDPDWKQNWRRTGRRFNVTTVLEEAEAKGE